MQFEDVVISHEWWRMLPDGTFQLYSGPLEASREHDPTFTKILIGSKAIAVFLDVPVPESLKAQMISNRPDWLEAAIHARIGSSDDVTVAVIEASTAVYGDVTPEACVFATACAASTSPQDAALAWSARFTANVSGTQICLSGGTRR